MNYSILGGLAGGDVRRTLATVAPVATGILGAILWPGHRILGGLAGLAVGRDAAGLASGSTTVRDAVESLGAHAVATAGSLALPGYPAIGYIAGAAAGGLALSHEGKSARDRLRDVLVGVLGVGAPSLDAVRAGSAVIRQGASGTSVKAVQALLREKVLMTKGEDDGNFDASDKEAVEDFQRQSGLAVDGAVGKDTLAALERGTTPGVPGKALQTLPTAPKPGMSIALPVALGVGGVALVVTSIVLATRGAR